MNEESIFFVEQIYLKYGKSKSHYKFIDMKINTETLKKLEGKEIYLFHYILTIMDRNVKSFAKSQLIELTFDDNTKNRVTKSKQEFYSLRNRFEELGLLIKYKKYSYFVNPTFINNLTSKQWDEVTKNRNNLWLINQGIRPTEWTIE